MPPKPVASSSSGATDKAAIEKLFDDYNKMDLLPALEGLTVDRSDPNKMHKFVFLRLLSDCGMSEADLGSAKPFFVLFKLKKHNYPSLVPTPGGSASSAPPPQSSYGSYGYSSYGGSSQSQADREAAEKKKAEAAKDNAINPSHFITKLEFQTAMSAEGCDSVAKLRSKLPSFDPDFLATSEPEFKGFYHWMFDFNRALDPQGRPRKWIEKSLALDLLQVVLPHPRGTHTNSFCSFIESYTPSSGASFVNFNKDQWNSFLPFCNQIKANFSNYSAETGAWPVLLDDYVRAQIAATSAASASGATVFSAATKQGGI